MSLQVYFEIGPLKESHYTGISQVTASLAERLLGDGTVEGHFFYGRMRVPKAVVEDLLKRRDGELLEWYLQRALPRTVPIDLNGRNVAIFPNRKSCRRVFARECQIVHDLSTLLTPQFHHGDTVDYHATSLEVDMQSNDITFCVSEATRGDVLAYFPGLAPESVQNLHLAADPAAAPHPGEAVEPFILVLGTIEPRKNVAQVLRYLRDHRDFADAHRCVFLGRFGWGKTIEDLIAEYDLNDLHARGRILFPGFVSEEVKSRLLRHAQLLVYPSLFEGFGLPVLEAAVLGVPCVTTRSSSLPEIGGTVCHYFDPFLDGDFERVLNQTLLEMSTRREEMRAACESWSRNFSWDKTYARMMGAIARLFDAPVDVEVARVEAGAG